MAKPALALLPTSDYCLVDMDSEVDMIQMGVRFVRDPATGRVKAEGPAVAAPRLKVAVQDRFEAVAVRIYGGGGPQDRGFRWGICDTCGQAMQPHKSGMCSLCDCALQKYQEPPK